MPPFPEILDDPIHSKPSNSPLASTIFSIAILGVCVLIWFWLKQAGHLPYDDNYANIAMAFLVSLITSVVLLFLFFMKRSFFFKNIYVIVFFFIVGSPLTVFEVCIHYKEIFGLTFRN